MMIRLWWSKLFNNDDRVIILRTYSKATIAGDTGKIFTTDHVNDLGKNYSSIKMDKHGGIRYIYDEDLLRI